jgi:UDPglucose--hexose-1-phosphate uridylyltransferase
MAGFEWGTGFYINPTPPEESAKFLRDAALPSAS